MNPLDLELLDAVVDGDTSRLLRTLRRGASPNATGPSGTSALCEACEHDQPEALRALIANGADVNAVDDRGWTALHHAIDAEGDFRNQSGSACDLRLVRPLLEAGADVNAAYTDGADHRTPLDMALDHDTPAAVEALRALGARGGDPRIP